MRSCGVADAKRKCGCDRTLPSWLYVSSSGLPSKRSVDEMHSVKRSPSRMLNTSHAMSSTRSVSYVWPLHTRRFTAGRRRGHA